MGKKVVFIFFVIFFIKSFISSAVVLSDYDGEIWIRKSHLGEWEELQENNVNLSDGFAVKTGNGKAKIVINNSIIWLKENTAFEVESASEFLNAFGLVYGKIKASIKGIGKKSRFSIKTMTAVCEVKRAEFMMESDIDGRMDVYVVMGEVEFLYSIPPKVGKRNFIIPQGTSLKIADVEKPYSISLITQEKEKEIFLNWDPRLKEEERIINIYEKENNKLLLRKFIAYLNTIDLEIANFIRREKESDFESGRTLKDINGNIVRIDQRLIRSDLKTVQIFNIIKRKTYKDYDYISNFSRNIKGFKYNGGALNNRIDLFITTFNFNKDMPKNIGEWPSFFDRSDVHPQWATFVSANLIDENSVFFIGEAYKYLNLRGELINNTEVVGVSQNSNERDNDIIIAGKINKVYLNDIVMYNFKEKDINNPSGELVKKTNNEDITGAFWGLKVSKEEIKDNNNFYQLNIVKYLKGANETNPEYFYLTQENYLISNSGKIKNRNDIFSSGKSISEIVNENAVQSVNYIKTDDNGVTENDYLDTYNIDLILIGDVPFNMFEKVSRGIDRWKD